MSGNCATGIAAIASRPAMVMTIEMTQASRGLSTKIAEIMARAGSRGASAARAGGRVGGDHRLARAHALDALHHDAVSLRDAV